VLDPKCFDLQGSGHWVRTLFSFIFVTFERYVVTNLRGTFVPVPISTNPTIQYPPTVHALRTTVYRGAYRQPNSIPGTPTEFWHSVHSTVGSSTVGVKAHGSEDSCICIYCTNT
jgi:hypothetical protein